jgi:hypothetical protein
MKFIFRGFNESKSSEKCTEVHRNGIILSLFYVVTVEENRRRRREGSGEEEG